MDELTIPVIYGSVREVRQGIKAARWVVKTLESLGAKPVLVDPLEHRLPLLDKMYKEFEPGTAPAVMEKLAQLFRGAGAFVIVSGEYNHGIPPALKNLLDHFLEEYLWRPAGIVSYSGGRWGGVRAAMQLRMSLAEMGMVTIPTTQPIANVRDAFSDDGTPTDPKFGVYAQDFFNELLWFARALREQRKTGVPY